MSHPELRRARRTIAVLATGGLLLGGVVAAAGSAQAKPDFELERLGGDNRYETGALIAAEYATSYNRAVLANGEPGSYADALTANYLAGVLDAPILLTQTDETPSEVLAQLKAAGVEEITVVGGPNVVSEEQVAALRAADYTVTRVSGHDRYLTNAAVIKAGGDAEETLGLVATGLNFPDALAGGPLSYDGRPLGLASPTEISDEVVTALKDAGVEDVLILGGPSAIGQQVETKLDAEFGTVTRLSGRDRAATAVAVAEHAVKELGFAAAGVNVASGAEQGYGADALAGGPLTGKQQRPLLVTSTATEPGAALLGYLEDHAATLADGTLFGGPSAVAGTALQRMNQAGRSVAPGTAAYDVTGGGAVDEGATVQYAVSGLPAGGDFKIALAEDDHVTRGADGTTTFTTGTGEAAGAADFGTVAADITEVNGVVITQPGPTYTGKADAQGKVTFVVRGASGTEEQVVPVVFSDTDGDGALDTDKQGKATEPFGAGGATTFATVSAIQAAPESALRAFGTQHTVTAQLAGDTLAAPRAGQKVIFQITREVNGTPAQDGAVVQQQVATTDAQGKASWSYTVSDPQTGTEGNDTVIDTVTVHYDRDSNGQVDSGSGAVSDTATVTWEDDAPAATAVTITQPAANVQNTVGGQQTVTAVVTDQYGKPLAGQAMTFEVSWGTFGSSSIEVTRTTDANGRATFTYQGPATARTDTVTATVVRGDEDALIGAIPPDPADLSDSVQVEWVAAGTAS
ncbi:cell wall-binding repeat-containing protein [Nocardioides pakistanensis]